MIRSCNDGVLYEGAIHPVLPSRFAAIVCLVLTCFFINPRQVESQSTPIDGLAGQPTDHIQLESLKTGLSVTEVARALGEPDHKGGSGVETWFYGESMVLFADGKVSAWSDHGELSEREETHQFDSFDPAASEPVEYPGWENAWTAEKLPDAAELLDSIVQE